MENQNAPLSDEKPLRVRRGRVDSVDLYEVKENELEVLEKGSPATLQLNFAIFLFSIASTCIVALTTTTFKWKQVESVFTIASVIGVLMGTYLLISWFRTKTSISSVIACIKDRIKEEPAPPASSASVEPKDKAKSNELPSG